MSNFLEQLLRTVAPPDPERAEVLWAEYRAGGKGADAAFATVVSWYGHRLYRRVWGFVRSDDAEDVFQDVLAKLHRERHALATFEDALRWLRAVAVNEAVDAHRRETRRKARERKASRPEGVSAPDEGGELREVVAVALGKLSPECREVVALVYFEELDRQAAAKVLGIHRDTVAARLTKALDQLRKCIPTPVALTGVATALSAQPPPLSAARLGELAATAWSKAVLSGTRVGMVAIVVGLVAVGGVAWAAWPRPDQPAAAAPRTATGETLPERNRRVLETDTLPRVVEILRPLALNGGEARLARLDVQDFRAVFDIELKHGGAPFGLTRSRFRVLLDTRSGASGVRFDRTGNGDFRPLTLDRPIVLLRVPELGIDWVARNDRLDRAVATLKAFPPDPRAADAAVRHADAVRVALAPYRGWWRYHGLPIQRSAFALEPVTGPDQQVHVPAQFGTVHATPFQLVVEPDGRVRLWEYDGAFTLTDGGRRLTLPGTAQWWEREK